MEHCLEFVKLTNKFAKFTNITQCAQKMHATMLSKFTVAYLSLRTDENKNPVIFKMALSYLPQASKFLLRNIQNDFAFCRIHKHVFIKFCLQIFI